jgi:hypothetical protein
MGENRFYPKIVKKTIKDQDQHDLPHRLLLSQRLVIVEEEYKINLLGCGPNYFCLETLFSP